MNPTAPPTTAPLPPLVVAAPVRLPPSHRRRTATPPSTVRRLCVRRVECDPRLFVRAFH